MTISRGAALRLARARRVNECDHVVLAHRPRGVAHVYVGPLTPSGGFIPRARRTACQRLHRRLTVDSTPPGVMSPGRPLCRRCVAALTPTGAATPTTRDDWVAEFGHLTAFDLALAAFMAQTPAEVDRVAFLALLVVGYPACAVEPVVSPAGKTTRPLDHHIDRARTRVSGHRPEELERARLYAEGAAIAASTGKANRRRAWQDREAAIERLGFVRATS